MRRHKILELVRIRWIGRSLPPKIGRRFVATSHNAFLFLNSFCITLSPLPRTISALSDSPQPTTAVACDYNYRQQTILINGRGTLVESYQPNGRGPFPLVFMLHGSAGAFSPKSASEPSMDNFGEKTLARNCFAVVLPHYLEALGYKSLTSRRQMAVHFPEILTATELLLDRAESLRWVKGRPVFLFGESFGGYLSIALAFRRSEVLAVSEFSGGLPKGHVLARRRAPGVLISHGDADTLVPVSEAEALRGYCVSNGIPIELNIYQGEGHYFSQTAQKQILARTAEFFRKEGEVPGDRLKILGQAPSEK